MTPKFRLRAALAAACLALFAASFSRQARADDDDNPPPTAQPAGRHFLGLLDARSLYGKDFFPDPILGPEFDAENQAELDYVHSEKRGTTQSEVDGGVQFNPVGELSLAAEAGWEMEHGPDDAEGDDAATSDSGMESVDLSAFHPVFQFVSDNRQLDYTAVARVDIALPTRTAISGKDAEVTPWIGHMLRVGQHFSVQAWTGSQFTIAPHPQNALIYGATFGYSISHEQLPLPVTEDLTPIVELDGTHAYSGSNQDALFGVAGFQLDLQSVGEIQPRLTVGYQFPLDQGARDQIDWGIVTEVFVDF